jgi:hypothetical protein
MPTDAASRHGLRTARDFALGSRIGLAVMAAGLAADLITQLDPSLDHDHGAMTGPQLSAHLVVFVGMTLVLVGVVVDGIRSTRRRGDIPQGSNRDAVR